MASRIYVVEDKKGLRSLVRATTVKKALQFKREQIALEGRIASQDEILELAGTVQVEDATANDDQHAG